MRLPVHLLAALLAVHDPFAYTCKFRVALPTRHASCVEWSYRNMRVN